MVSYKKLQLIEAFNAMPHHQLIIGGNGTKFSDSKIAKINIQLVGL
jgi:hypothetical protein